MTIRAGEVIRFNYGSPVAFRTGKVVNIRKNRSTGNTLMSVDHGNGLYRTYKVDRMTNITHVSFVSRVLTYFAGSQNYDGHAYNGEPVRESVHS